MLSAMGAVGKHESGYSLLGPENRGRWVARSHARQLDNAIQSHFLVAGSIGEVGRSFNEVGLRLNGDLLEGKVDLTMHCERSSGADLTHIVVGLADVGALIAGRYVD